MLYFFEAICGSNSTIPCLCTISHNLYGRNYLCSFYLINSFSRNIELTCPNLLKAGQSHMTNSGHQAVNRINICHVRLVYRKKKKKEWEISVHVFHMVNLKYDRTLFHHSPPSVCQPMWNMWHEQEMKLYCIRSLRFRNCFSPNWNLA